MSKPLVWLLLSHLSVFLVGMWAYAENAPAPDVQVRTVEGCKL